MPPGWARDVSAGAEMIGLRQRRPGSRRTAALGGGRQCPGFKVVRFGPLSGTNQATLAAAALEPASMPRGGSNPSPCRGAIRPRPGAGRFEPSPQCRPLTSLADISARAEPSRASPELMTGDADLAALGSVLGERAR